MKVLRTTTNSRSSRLEVFCSKVSIVFLESLQNSPENTCVRISFLIKLQALGSERDNSYQTKKKLNKQLLEELK